MTQDEFLAQIAALLEQADIPFMVTGSLGSSIHGRPRATQDVDLVIDPTGEQLGEFLGALGPGYYVSRPAALAALASRSLFNVIDLDGGWKADLILRKDRPFSVEEFRRRQPAEVRGRTFSVATPEDVILSKLEWDRITPSERQVADAVHVAAVQGDRLDVAYLRKWAPELAVVERLDYVLQEAAKVRAQP